MSIKIVKHWDELPPTVYVDGEPHSTRLLYKQYHDQKDELDRLQSENRVLKLQNSIYPETAKCSSPAVAIQAQYEADQRIKAIQSELDKVRGERDELKNGKRPDRVSFWFMYDNHTFTKLEGKTVDEILEHLNEVCCELPNPETGCPGGSYGTLCPARLLAGDKEIRSVGTCVHYRGLNDPKPSTEEWREAVEADEDIMRILEASHD